MGLPLLLPTVVPMDLNSLGFLSFQFQILQSLKIKGSNMVSLA